MIAAVDARDQALAEVVAARPHTSSAGLDVIRAWARKGRPFSLNDCRADLHAVGVTGQYAPGGLVMRAIKLRIIRKVGLETSTSRATHGKAIAVQRDRGRFTSTTSAPAPDALFDLEVVQP